MRLKKVIGFVAATALIIGALAGCGNKNTGNEGTTGAENAATTNHAGDTAADTASADEAVTIRLLTRMAGTSKQVEIYNGILDEFKAKHPNVTIIDDSQGDESAFNNILSTDIASGKMANIFRIQGVSNLEKYIDNGLIMDVSKFLEEDPEWNHFSEGSLNYYSVPNHSGKYAIPMESGLIGVFYNQALFEKAGISTFPETWNQLLEAIDKLNAAGIIPIAIGEQSTYMGGHLHNQIFYKWMGTEAIKKLGNRELKWTDPEVVKTLDFIKVLIDRKAFEDAAAGMTDDVAMTKFQQGEAAMVITGPWNISNFSDPEKTPVTADIRIAKFPYFEEKPEFKNHDMQVLSPYMISGKLEGKELELTIELVKMLTSKEAAESFAQEVAFLIPRTDLQLDESKCKPLFIKSMELGATSEGIGVDVFDFDPLPSMQDRTRNSILSLFIGASAADAAAEIQAEIDNN